MKTKLILSSFCLTLLICFVAILRAELPTETPAKNSVVAKDAKVEFTRQILPVLSKLGCNSGACHGALAGKGGFKLSLNAYNPKGDHAAITHQARGRRIELADPGRSLLLAKPTGVLPHKGGLKLDVDSEDYKLLADWIASGAPGPTDSDAKLERLEVEPKQVSLKMGETSQLTVRAFYSDGKVEDVTKWAKFTSSDLPVAIVDKAGQTKIVGRGEAAIVVWFSSQLAMAKVQVPFDNMIDEKVFADAPKRNFIDNLVLQKLKSLNLEPSPRCDDPTFVRRAFLDTVGMIPTAEEVTTFLENDSPDKRDELIDDLLERKEYVDFWTYRWSDVFLINGKRLRPKAVKSYYQWLRKNVEDNVPWDKVVYEVVTAQGSSYENGATNFLPCTRRQKTWPRTFRKHFLVCRLDALNATTILSKNGRTTSITRWRICFLVSARKGGAVMDEMVTACERFSSPHRENWISL